MTPASMSQVIMKLVAILAIVIPLAAAEQYITGYSDLECTVPISTITCSRAWNQCVGFGNYANSFLVWSDSNDACNPIRGLWNYFQLSCCGCSGGDGRGYGCGGEGCQLTVNCDDNGDGNCVDSPADAVTCSQTW